MRAMSSGARCMSNRRTLECGRSTCAGRWQGALVAIKIVERALGNMDQEDENAREALVAASVSHPNVVRLPPVCVVHAYLPCNSDILHHAPTVPTRHG